eukprot:11550735-Ditylum_brightwellii.AAC.1
MHRAIVKLYKMYLCTFVAQIKESNDWLEQFPPRDDGTPQVKLADERLMDILESAMLMSWQAEMQRQHFNCTAKGQAKFIRFCENLNLLDPTKDKAQKGGPATISSITNNKQILKKKRGREADSASLSTRANECKTLQESAKHLKDKIDGNCQSCHSSSGERNRCYNKEELNAIIGKSIKAALKKECHGCI